MRSLGAYLVERARSLSAAKGRKSRIIVTDNMNNPVYLAAGTAISDFAEMSPVSIKFTKERFAAQKGYSNRPHNSMHPGEKTGSVDTTLSSMQEMLGIGERDILPFISASISLKTGEADAILGGIDAPTEALIAGCSLVMNYGVPSAEFFTQVKIPASIGMVRKYHDNIYEITLPDGRAVIVSYPSGEGDPGNIAAAADEASKRVIDPVVAFISFSTDGKAYNRRSEMMKKACREYLNSRSSNTGFGDIQLDASLDRDILIKKLDGRDPFMGRCANCLVYPDATSAHSFIDYFEWAYNGYNPGRGEGAVIAVADMAIKPEPNPVQLSRIITESMSTYLLLTDRKPVVALIGHDDYSREKCRKAVSHLPGEALDCLCDSQAVPLKDALTRADLFIYPELAQGNPAYKAWQILNPGFFVTQGFEYPVCDLSRGDDDPEKIITTIAYLTIKAFAIQENRLY